MMDNRHTEEGVERLFADLFDIVIAPMLRRIFKIHRFCPFANISHQAFAEFQGDVANRALIQASSRHKDIFITFFIQQVNAANLGSHRFLNAIHNNIQGGTQVTGLVDFLYHPAKNFKHCRSGNG